MPKSSDGQDKANLNTIQTKWHIMGDGQLSVLLLEEISVLDKTAPFLRVRYAAPEFPRGDCGSEFFLPT